MTAPDHTPDAVQKTLAHTGASIHAQVVAGRVPKVLCRFEFMDKLGFYAQTREISERLVSKGFLSDWRQFSNGRLCRSGWNGRVPSRLSLKEPFSGK